ncbi:hypothetical protein FAZ95_25830 [Trinickia violacea]|uniref:Uncharacterized protein n=1 Tax=Trinickia violacea TaxID=2571746 RepID=A0A4P8IVU2_9BURK|nr:hypothetical protein [Trinickia violacea]QCP52581.1 hypothetical protein FAZ95_25830 [Trinickia violacea]
MATPNELAATVTFKIVSYVDPEFVLYVKRGDPGQLVSVTSQPIPKSSLSTWIYDGSNSKLFLKYDFDATNEDGSYKVVGNSSDAAARIKVTVPDTDDCRTWTMTKFNGNLYRFDSVEKPGLSLGLPAGVGDDFGVKFVPTDVTWQTPGQIWQCTVSA